VQSEDPAQLLAAIAKVGYTALAEQH
jgi:hypothetical protein